jgi:hypothetical protein
MYRILYGSLGFGKIGSIDDIESQTSQSMLLNRNQSRGDEEIFMSDKIVIRF